MLILGYKMPSFEVQYQNGNIVRYEDFIGDARKTIIYFYPKGNIFGSTAEACSFRDNYAALIAAGYNVVGVSMDSTKFHSGFLAKYGLLFREESKKYTDGELLDIFADPETPVFVYEKGSIVLGYVICALMHLSSGSLNAVTSLYVDAPCVDGNARGQHIGKALFDYVKAYAKQQGCHNITLHVWKCNPGTRAFYESLGLSPQYTSMELLIQ